MKVSTNLRSPPNLSQSIQCNTTRRTIYRSLTPLRLYHTSILKGHSTKETTKCIDQFDIHHTFWIGTNFTKHTHIFSRHYADPKDKKKESKEKDTKEKAAPAESKDAKKDAKKDEKPKGGKKKVETAPKRQFDLYNLFKDKPMSKTAADKVPQWFVDMAVQFNAGTLGKELKVDTADLKSVKRYLRKMSKKRINNQNKESVADSGEGEGDEDEEKLPLPPRKVRLPTASAQQ